MNDLPDYENFNYQSETVIVDKQQGLRGKEWNRRKSRRKMAKKSQKQNRRK